MIRDIRDMSEKDFAFRQAADDEESARNLLDGGELTQLTLMEAIAWALLRIGDELEVANRHSGAYDG